MKILEEKSRKQCDILWLKCDKQYFNLDNSVYICGTYIPPHNSKYLKDNKIDMFSFIGNDVTYIQQLEHVTVCGDFNSKIGGNNDSLTENEKFHELLNIPETMCMTHYHQGDQWTQTQIDTTNLSLICYSPLILINGRKLGDLTRSVTCYEWNRCSLIIF